MIDAQDLIHKGREEGKDEKVAEAVIEMNNDGVPTSTMAKYLKISEGKMSGVKSLSFTFYEDKTYFTQSEIFNDVYSHSGTYRF